MFRWRSWKPIPLKKSLAAVPRSPAAFPAELAMLLTSAVALSRTPGDGLDRTA